MPPNEVMELAFQNLPKETLTEDKRKLYDNIWAARKCVTTAVEKRLPGFTECHPSDDAGE